MIQGTKCVVGREFYGTDNVLGLRYQDIGCKNTNRFGTSINIGAVIPRYSLVTPSFLMILRKQSNTPLYPWPSTAVPCCSCIRVFTTSSGYLATFLAASFLPSSIGVSHHQNLVGIVSRASPRMVPIGTYSPPKCLLRPQQQTDT